MICRRLSPGGHYCACEVRKDRICFHQLSSRFVSVCDVPFLLSTEGLRETTADTSRAGVPRESVGLSTQCGDEGT